MKFPNNTSPVAKWINIVILIESKTYAWRIWTNEVSCSILYLNLDLNLEGGDRGISYCGYGFLNNVSPSELRKRAQIERIFYLLCIQLMILHFYATKSSILMRMVNFLLKVKSFFKILARVTPKLCILTFSFYLWRRRCNFFAFFSFRGLSL